MTREEQRAVLVAEAASLVPKEISAMLRIRNEEEFLRAAVLSILEWVDEVVLIDNLSTDDTPRIVSELERAWPGKIRAFSYPHEILRVGRDNWTYSTQPDRQGSPRLSANYYNWCLERCSKPYVLKWDADMVAREAFALALGDWRQKKKPVLSIFGVNVHPDRDCYVAPRCTDREPLLARLEVPALPLWVTVLTRDTLEPRLFPRRFARYGFGKHWTQQLESPCTDKEVRKELSVQPEEASFLHLKFCKRDPYANYSDDLARVIACNIKRGPPLDGEAHAVLRRFGLAPRI